MKKGMGKKAPVPAVPVKGTKPAKNNPLGYKKK